MLDVTAFLWTARRVFAKAATRIPEDPEWDELGLRMELVR
jgi:predicted RNase H-like nuclease